MKRTIHFQTVHFTLLFLLTTFLAKANNAGQTATVNALLFQDTCFTTGQVGTSFDNGSAITGLDADLMIWNGSGWTGSWSGANLTLPPVNESSCRAIFIGSGSVWTTGGEGFGLLLNTPLVAGQQYDFTFTYVSHGTGSNGDFSPTLFTSNDGQSIFSAIEVGQIPSVGYDWETNTYSFTATPAQDGQQWIILHSTPDGSSGMVGSYCCGEVDDDCGGFSGSVTTTDADCLQGGSATASASGSCSNPIYNWSTGETGSSILDLPAGDYTITISDNCCESIQAFSILAPLDAPAVDLGADLSFCAGSSVNLDAENIGAFYEWSTGAITQTIQVNTPGNYSVTVTNSNGCSSTDEINVDLTILDLSLNAFNISCDPTMNQIDLNVNNGQAPYTYFWNTGATTQDIDNLTPGWYYVTITDFNNCVANDSIEIDVPVVITAQTTPTDNSCPESQGGLIDLEVLTGDPPFTFAWSNGDNTEDITNLSDGDYIVTITDANGCTTTVSESVSGPPSFQYGINGIDACGIFGQAYITVNSGGTAPYTYLWSNGGTTDVISDLGSGNYTVTVTDASNCTFVASTTVVTFPEVILDWDENDVSCFGFADGAIDLSVVQGLSPFLYNWDTGSTTQDIDNLPAGNYTISVTDANSCLSAVTIEVQQPNPISLNVSTTLPVNGNDGALTIEPVGGTPPFTASWDNGDMGLTADSLGLGMHTVVVVDAAGCTHTQTINLTLTSIDENENILHFNIYPNPNDGRFFVDMAFAKRENAIVQIFDVLGQEIFAEDIFTLRRTLEVNVNALASGMYFIVLKTADYTHTERVVIE